MEKKTYDTAFDILTNNSAEISNQFYIIQNDGTTNTKDKELQTVTQMQEVKGIIEGGNETEECPVFDATQQFYVYNVSPELISIHDQYAIPSVENNVYANTFLIQPEPSTATQQIETKCIETMKIETELSNVETNNLKMENDLTEITLSDEQYHILEQKGWILLESSDKIFVLNSLGLHDITNNDALIHKLKNDLHDPDLEMNLRNYRTENLYKTDIEEKSTEPEENKVHFVLINNEQNEQSQDDMQTVLNENIQMEIEDKPIDPKVKMEIPFDSTYTSDYGITEANEISIKPKCDSIKIKTKYNFKDIPDKIFLGKTVNGKKLFAKITRKNNISNANVTIQLQNVIQNIKEKKNSPMYILKKKQQTEKNSQAVTALDTGRFINLIQDTFRSLSQVNTKHVEDISSHICQLMRLPSMQDSLVGNHLILTKIVTSKTVYGNDIGQPSVITGTVKMQNGKGTFIHIPRLLQNLLERSENEKSNTDEPPASILNDVIELFHIHVSETQYFDKLPQTSIHLSKRKLPLNVLKDAKKRHASPIYACGSCGVIFKTETLLKDHQNNQCMEGEDELTIDTADEMIDNNEKLYTVTKTGKTKCYTCNICQAKFSKLFNCNKHIKTHTTALESKGNVYKCKMCPGVYHHASSLSKHIMKMHIQIKPK